MNYILEWNKEGNNLNIPIKIENSVDTGYGYSGKLVCNQCQNGVDQFYVCPQCGDKAKIGEIKKRRDEKTELIYEEAQKKDYLKHDRNTTVKVTKEIDTGALLRHLRRFEKPYEVFNNDTKISPVIAKIHGYMIRNQKALIVQYGDDGGVLIAGNGQLELHLLRDYRLIRQNKQVGLPMTIDDEVSQTMDMISESPMPHKLEAFLEMVKTGQKIDVTMKEEKPKILVECSFLDA